MPRLGFYFCVQLTAGLGILVAVVALMMSACVLVPNQLEEIDLDVVFQSGADDRFLATRLAFDHIMKKIPSYFLAPFYYQYFHSAFPSSIMASILGWVGSGLASSKRI